MRSAAESCYCSLSSFWLLIYLCFLALLEGLYLGAPGIKRG